jgi:hypothetical protein
MTGHNVRLMVAACWDGTWAASEGLDPAIGLGDAVGMAAAVVGGDSAMASVGWESA